MLEDGRAAFLLNNFSKAKASLVLARTSANGAYTTPQLQVGREGRGGG